MMSPSASHPPLIPRQSFTVVGIVSNISSIVSAGPRLCEDFLMPVSKRRKRKHSDPTPASRAVVFDMPVSHRCGCDGSTREIMYSNGVLEFLVAHDPDPCGWRRVNTAMYE
jgi:hypothetical protein